MLYFLLLLALATTITCGNELSHIQIGFFISNNNQLVLDVAIN